MMKIQFLGIGTQFSSHEQYHSNMVITARSGKRMLIDCGSDVRFSLAESNLCPKDLDAVYISHLHADHIGGLEWLALSTYFSHDSNRLKLFCEAKLQSRLWHNSLKGGLECLGECCLKLDDYFDCHSVEDEGSFDWEGMQFTLVKMPHITGPCCKSYSYGLLVNTTDSNNSVFFITTDTIFVPKVLESFAEKVDVIFHDCETSELRTTVHAHYDQLCTLPKPVKHKIWLYHYQPDSGHNPQSDGFLGFVVKGQVFSFPPDTTEKRCQ